VVGPSECQKEIRLNQKPRSRSTSAPSDPRIFSALYAATGDMSDVWILWGPTGGDPGGMVDGQHHLDTWLMVDALASCPASTADSNLHPHTIKPALG
jgi:hypothetical protein